MDSPKPRQRGQSLVIVALSATVLIGVIALGLDGGRLYLARRDVQNAADGGALAGAIDLIPALPGTAPDFITARYDAVKFALRAGADTIEHATALTTRGSPSFGRVAPSSFRRSSRSTACWSSARRSTCCRNSARR